MPKMDPQVLRECKKLGNAMHDADPVEVLQNAQKLFRLYGEQPLTLDDAGSYLFIIADGILNGRLTRMGRRDF